MAALAAEGLELRRRGRRVLAGVTLALDAGAAAQVTGANASGKSTLLRALAGLARPAAGRLVLPPGSRAFVPERVALSPQLTPRGWLLGLRRVRGLPALDAGAALAAAGLAPELADRPVARLSKGELQRVVLADALAGPLRLLLLDEPFAGLDADGRAWLGGQVAARRADGCVVVLTDHTGAGADVLAPDVLVALGGGRAQVREPTAPAATPVRIRSRAPDGSVREELVAREDRDARLRALLDAGHGIEEVGEG